MKEVLGPGPLLTNASALNIQILFDLGTLQETSISVGRHVVRTSKLIDFSLANLIKLFAVLKTCCSFLPLVFWLLYLFPKAPDKHTSLSLNCHR